MRTTARTRRPAPARLGSVIIPAHDEEQGIARTLRLLEPLVSADLVEVVVACNGCHDATADVARGFDGVTVVELDTASKTAALNAADAVATSWPRLYLDADVAIAPDAVTSVLDAVRSGPALAARPDFHYDLTQCSPLVAAYYRARGRLEQSRSGLWGAGAYALNEEAHARFGAFPDVTADDVFVEKQFSPEEREHVMTAPVVVRVATSLGDLMGVLRRQARGPKELGVSTARSTARELVTSVRGPLTAADAAVYATLAALSRLPRRTPARWERDESGRAHEAAREGPVRVPHGRGRGFRGPDGVADVTAVVVTFQSAECIDDLLETLRAEADSVSIRAVVVDNGSTDGTLDRVRRNHPDVTAVGAGANLGYAGGINAAAERVGSCRSVLVLNPDLVVLPGSVSAMLRRLDASGAGVAVPRILDHERSVYPSQRREPTLARALGDAVLGSRWPSRPGWLSETVFCAAAYTQARPVDWATGAAMLVRSWVAAEVGPWDERFFLYSEETDYARRLREADASIWFEPRATVVHAQGGSGTAPELAALRAVNRVRYVRKFHSRPYAAVFRAITVLGAGLRSWRAEDAAALRHLLRESSWKDLEDGLRSPAREVATP